MLFLDVLYTALTTICVMIILQVVLFAMVRIMYPPEPRIIYRDVPQHIPQVYQPPTVLTEQPKQEVKLPEYEPRDQISGSLRLDPQLPPGLQETRPDGL
jgi:hypothetical protein